MKKTTAIIVAALITALAATAVKPIDKAFPVKQPDGTTVMLFKHGNGHLAFYSTTDGKVVVRNDEGTLCYAQLDGDSLTATAVVCHDIDERTADEQSFVESITLTPQEASSAVSATSDPHISKVFEATSSDGLGVYGTSASGPVSSIGEITVPVIMVNFSDVSFQEEMTIDKVTRYFNEEGYCEDNDYEVGSVRDYFVANSRGMFTPTFDIVAKVTLSNGYSYYGANDRSGSDTNAFEMVKEAITLAIAAGVDFTQYKVDGVLPNVIVFYAGCGEATGGDDDTIWPHTGILSGVTVSGFTLKSYFVGNELYGTSSSSVMMGMGVFAHEFSHCLGLPDLYDTTGGTSYPWGYWSVLDLGCYTSSAYAPIGYSAYEKCFLGWYDMPELTEAQAVTLTDPNADEGDFGVFFRNPSDEKEYFVLENRQQGTWYPSSVSGLLVSRWAYSSSVWQNNTLNTNSSKMRSYVVTADGSTPSSSTLSSAAVYGNGTNNKTTHDFYDGTTGEDQPIYKVITQPDNMVTFNYIERDLETTAVSNTDVYELVTDATTLAAADTLLIVNEEDAVAMCITAQNTYCRKPVSVLVSEGQAWGNDLAGEYVLYGEEGAWRLYYPAKSVFVSSHNSGTTVTSSKTSANAYATIAINDGTATIHFTGTAGCTYLAYDSDEVNFTCFADETANVQLYRKVDAASGIAAVKASSGQDVTPAAVYTIAGSYVGTSLVGLPQGIYISNGKKYIVK